MTFPSSEKLNHGSHSFVSLRRLDIVTVLGTTMRWHRLQGTSDLQEMQTVKIQYDTMPETIFTSSRHHIIPFSAQTVPCKELLWRSRPRSRRQKIEKGVGVGPFICSGLPSLKAPTTTGGRQWGIQAPTRAQRCQRGQGGADGQRLGASNTQTARPTCATRGQRERGAYGGYVALTGRTGR
jgi:hypothetical protein